jgi:putative MATE family efflux protein
VLSLFVSIASTMLVGHLGAAALTAVGLSGTVAMISTFFYSAAATGATALVAQAVGAGDRDIVNRILGQAMLLGILMGVGITVLLFPFSRQALVLMGSQPDSLGMGTIYLQWQAATMLPMALLMVGNAALRGAGDTRTPMLIMGGVNIINVGLSLLLIHGWFGVPAMGVTGAAIATGVSRVAGGVALLLVLLRGQYGLRLEGALLRPDREILRRLLKVGVPAGAESMLMSTAFLAYTRAISSLGTAAYAAYLIAQRVESMNTMPAFGFSMAATTLAGQSLGAGDLPRARRSVLEAIRISTLLAIAWALVCAFAPRFMLGLFTNDPAVIELGVLPLRFVALAQPLMSLSFTLAGGLRGMGDTRSSMTITAVGSWVVRVPLAILSVTLLGWGLPGVQASMTMDWLTRSLLLAWRFSPRAWAARSQKAIISAQTAS